MKLLTYIIILICCTCFGAEPPALPGLLSGAPTIKASEPEINQSFALQWGSATNVLMYHVLTKTDMFSSWEYYTNTTLTNLALTGLHEMKRFFAIYAEVTNSLTVDIEWDASRTTNVTYYKVYYGVKSGSYDYNKCVTNNLSALLPNLMSNTNYFISVTALNQYGVESDFSTEFICLTSSNMYVNIKPRIRKL